MPNKILASENKLALPDEKLLQNELKKTQKLLYERKKTTAIKENILKHKM
ncbi:MAG: hypothetical protein HY963_09230 [Ignavibacteriales bacterium]|nr:hypothetical protein [Ignavibacteriales bacterium]